MGINVEKYKTKQLKSNAVGFRDLTEILNKDIHFWGSAFNDKKKERFYSELNILLEAGLDIKSAFDIIEIEVDDSKQKNIIETIKNKLINGSSLSLAMNTTGHFSNHEVFSIKIGEESGKIKEVLKDLALYFEQKIKQKRQLMQAMMYPIVILITATLAVVFMLNFVVPMFAEVYKRFNTELPYITKMIINASDFASGGLMWFLLFLCTTVALIYYYRKSELFRKSSSTLLLKMPIIGSIIRKIYIARFCHSMQLLLMSKVPMIESIDLAGKMVAFYPLEKHLERVNIDLFNGKHLYHSLGESSLFDRRLIALIRVGEESNRLDKMFHKLSEQYVQDIEHSISTLSSVMEPLILILLGFFVAVILIAMYLPMFKLSSSFGV